MRYFEDLREGETVQLGSTSVTEEEILEFARRYDPQPFHLDPAAAEASIYGGLIASGWHTCALFMRLLATGFLNETASLGSPGVDELRWLQPVRPGQTLSGAFTIQSARLSSSRPDRGIVTSQGTLANEGDETVLSMVATNLIGCRGDA